MPIQLRRQHTFDHYRTLRSTLFELLLACRLLVPNGQVWLESDKGPSPFSDMTATVNGSPIVRVEACGPQRGLESWYEDGVLRPWREVALGESAPVAKEPVVRDFSIDQDAFVKALAGLLTSSNFAPKAKQLSAGGLPTILAVRAYGLTERLEEILTMPRATELAQRMGDQAWSRLPSQCQGILVSLLGDVLHDVLRRQSPVMFVPAPGRVLQPALWDYLDAAGMLPNEAARRLTPAPASYPYSSVIGMAGP